MCADSVGPVIPVAADDGFNYVKIVTGNMARAFPSRARPGSSRSVSVLGGDQAVREAEYRINGALYTAGCVDGEDTLYDDYPTSALNAVNVHHALQMAGLGGQRVRLMTGLPVDMYYTKGDRVGVNDALVTAKGEALTVTVSPAGDRAPVQVVAHDCISEGYAAWFDYIIQTHEDGSPIRLREREREHIAIVDVGGRTTDIVAIADRRVQLNHSRSIDAGMLWVRRRLKDLLRDRFANLSAPSERFMDMAMAGRVTVFGQVADVSSELAAAKAEVAERIKSEVNRCLGSGIELDRVLFVGGGALALQAETRALFPHQVTVEEPQFANARGMAKYLTHVLMANA